jgi:hypothetical protein
MDNVIRAQLETKMDDIFKDLIKGDNIRNIAEWIMDFENYDHLIKSSEELITGYFIGYSASILHDIILDNKRNDKVSTRMEFIKQNNIQNKKSVVIIKINKKEVNLVRSIIKTRLPAIREEIIKALNI